MIHIEKLNNSYLRVYSDDTSFERDLRDHFSFKADGYQFSPKYKAGIWDGSIRLYNIGTKQLSAGLLNNLLDFCTKYDDEVQIDERLTNEQNSITKEEVESFINSLNVYSRGKPLEARDYQIECIYQSIKQKRLVSKVPTSGGKSFIIYCIMRWFIDQELRFCLIVPTVSLVKQMYSDFLDYSSHNGFDVSKNVHNLHSGEAKEFSHPVLISTWQSINAFKKTNKNYRKIFNTYDAVTVDECHLATGTALTAILESMVDIEYRFGTTGTIDNKKVNQLTIEGNIGPIYSAITTKELIERGQVSDIEIKSMVLKFPPEDCGIVKDLKYNEQEEYAFLHPKRLRFLQNIALSTKGTTLILCAKVEKQAIPIYDKLKEKSTRPVYLIIGDVEADVREKIRQLANIEDCIIVASYATMSTGISIPNIRYVIFGSSSKSMVRVLQSIGRGLRLHSDKEKMVLIDIVDNLQHKKKLNYAMTHFQERLKMYQKEKFTVKITEVPL